MSYPGCFLYRLFPCNSHIRRDNDGILYSLAADGGGIPYDEEIHQEGVKAGERDAEVHTDLRIYILWTVLTYIYPYNVNGIKGFESGGGV